MNNLEHPLLHSLTSKIHQDTQTPLWSRGNEIYHLGIWRRDQRTPKEGRSSHRIPIRVWTRDTEKRSWSQEWSEREGLVGKRLTKGFPNFITKESLLCHWDFKLHWSDW